MCRSRRELSNEYLLAKIGVDSAENEPLEVWGKIFNIIDSYRSSLSMYFSYVPSIIFSFFNRPLFSIFFQIDPNSNAYLLAKIGFDTAENEPFKVR